MTNGVADSGMVGAPSCAYELNDQLQLVAVDEGWRRFASENGAPELASPPLGRSILTFIEDAHTRQLYADLFWRVQSTGLPVSFGIRCDSPTVRRHLQLTIAPLGGGGFRMSTTLIRSEPNPGGALLDRTAPRDTRLVRSCSWCKKVEVGSAWLEVTDAVAPLRLFEEETLPALTHGICPACFARVAGP